MNPVKVWAWWFIFILCCIVSAVFCVYALGTMGNQEIVSRAGQEFPGVAGFIIGGAFAMAISTLPVTWSFRKLRESMFEGVN